MNQNVEIVSEPQTESRGVVAASACKSLVRKIADRFSVQPDKLLDTLKQTAFRQRDNAPPVTNEQMMALLVVADQYRLNPFTREVYAFPDKQSGIIPIVGIDGWSRIINSHDQFDGIDFRASENIIQIPEAKACPEWIECVIYRKDRGHPLVIREYLDEVYRPPFRDGIKGPWQTHTKRFLRHKAMIQAARIAFGFVGIYDQEEGERILEGEIVVDSDAPQTSAADLNAKINTARKPAQETEAPAQETASKPEKAADEQSDDTQPDTPPVTAAQILELVESADGADVLDECEDLANSLDKRSREYKAIISAIGEKRKELGISIGSMG